jgi:hypothetical protein
LKKTFITTVLTAVKKNKQPTHTPGGPGRLRSWSGPVETDFQGRLRFSYANMPGTGEYPEGGYMAGGSFLFLKEQIKDIIIYTAVDTA